MSEKTYIVAVDTMVSVKASSEEEALDLAAIEFKNKVNDLELIVDEVIDEL